MNAIRPKNLNLFTIHFPIPAIVSILHRATGAFLFLLIPFTLWALAYSFTESGFTSLQQNMHTLTFKIVFWILFVPFCFHLVAGIRHLLSDMHIGSSLKAGRLAAYLTFVVTFIFVALAGLWIW